ncbi:MAG: extracellular solute-binding protein [Clostridiaceae bacterium]
MWKLMNRFFLILLAVAMAAPVFTACGNAEKTNGDNSNETVVLTFYDKNTDDAFTDDVAKEITRRTGVTVKIMPHTGNSEEQLNLMLANRDYPDMVLMDRHGSTVDKYISAGALISLNELIQKYGENVTSMYGGTLDKIKGIAGNIYYLPNWYGESSEPMFGMLMRQDILKDLAGDKAENGKGFTQDGFTRALMEFKEKYPVINGKSTLPLTFPADNMFGVIHTMKGMFGLKTYYQVNGKLKYDARDPRYLEMLKYFNSLYRMGLIDKEWVANKKKLWEEKVSEGRTFVTLGSYWDVADSNAEMKKTIGEKAQMYSYNVVGNGVQSSETTYGARSSLGWDAIGITNNCRNPESAMKLINFLSSEEGQYLMLWGIEGKSWNIVDGKHKPTDKILQAFRENPSAASGDTGIRKWTWFIKNGNGSDGTPYDLTKKYIQSQEQIEADKNMKGSSWDTAEYELLLPESETREGLMYQNVSEIFIQAFPKIIDAASEEECVRLYHKMISDMDSAGLEKVEKVINENYEARKKLWK